MICQMVFSVVSFIHRTILKSAFRTLKSKSYNLFKKLCNTLGSKGAHFYPAIYTCSTTDTMEKKELFKNMPYMSPMTNRMEASKEKGFTENFEVTAATTMINYGNNELYSPQEVTIVNHYRFEGMTDPGDNNIMYEIETHDGKQGILITPYGSDCPAHIADFVANIPKIEKRHFGVVTDSNHAQTPLDVTIPSNTTSSEEL